MILFDSSIEPLQIKSLSIKITAIVIAISMNYKVNHLTAQSAFHPQPFLDAFLLALDRMGMPSSRESLLVGQPVTGEPDIDLLVRAAQRKGLNATLAACKLDQIQSAALPLILPLNDPQYAVAVIESISHQQNEFRLTLFATTGTAESVSMTRQAFAKMYSGRAVFLARAFDAGASDAGVPQTERNRPTFARWLLNECYKMRSVYRDVLLASLFLNLFALASPLFVMNVYDRVVPNQALETLWVLAGGVVVVFVFDLTIKLLRHYFVESAGKRIDVVLSGRLFEQVLSLRAEVFPKSVGAFASNLKDFDAIKQFLTATTLTSLIDLPFALVFVLIIYSLGGAVVMAPLIAALVIIVYGIAVHFPLRTLIEKSQAAAAQKNAVLVETLSGMETIKAFNASGRQQYFWEQCNAYLAGTGLSSRRLADSIAIVSSFVMQLAVVFVVVIGVYQISEHSMSLGALIACVLLSSRALAPMAQLANLAAQYYQAKTAIKALNDLTQLPVEHGVDDSAQNRYLHRDVFKGDIEFSDVSFRYDDKQAVLKNLNLKIKAGEKVALIGKIGSGKSTLFRLLLSLGKVSSGQIKVDDIDIDQLDPVELRASIGYVPQDIMLFRGTLKENILLKAPQASHEALLEAADLAGLGDFVKGNSSGFDLPIGEQGQGLSGGQRQSVAIARAVVNAPSILLFDELTSAMDNQTESQVVDHIKTFSEGKTLLLSTHRASLLSLVDRVVVLDDGRIIADGPKDKVLDALKRGLIKTRSQAERA